MNSHLLSAANAIGQKIHLNLLLIWLKKKKTNDNTADPKDIKA
jgi:hypothetical protein